MPYSERDIVQNAALLRGQVAGIPTQQNGVDMLSQLSDVSIGIDVDVANGDVLKWVAADGLWENLPGGSGFPVGPDDDGTSTATISHTIPTAGTGAVYIDVTDDAVPGNLARTASTVSSTTVDTGFLSFTGVGQAAYATSEVTASSAKTEIEAIFGAGTEGKITIESTGGNSAATIVADSISFPSTSSTAGFGINVGAALPTSDPGVSGQLYALAGVVMVSP